MALISVIIPVFNGEKTIQTTIKSVVNQCFGDWELIIINDGSQDCTLEIIKKIVDHRLRVFSYPNAGQAISRNRGLSHAKGEYISFLDADDIWTSDKLEAQLRALQNNPQASVAYSWTDYIDEQGNFLISGTHITVNGNVYEKLLVNNFLENGSNPLIKRQALVEVGGFEPSVTPAEDWELWLRLAAHYNFVAVPSPQILYRVSATSESANLLRMEAACLKVISVAFAQAQNSVKLLESQSIANLYKYLTCKVLQPPFTRQKGCLGVRFLWKFFINNSDRLQRTRFIFKLLFKIFVIIILPADLAALLLTSLKAKVNQPQHI